MAKLFNFGFFGSSYTHFDQKPQGIDVVKVADIPALVRALFK